MFIITMVLWVVGALRNVFREAEKPLPAQTDTGQSRALTRPGELCQNSDREAN